ncbi:MAG TPA: hemolysin III family protein [Methanothrix sp.]|nr:hemolysin III family protein [Methanothrix sp.]
MPLRKEELFNFYSHLLGMVAALIGTGFLIVAAKGSVGELITAIIYGISIIFLFSASTLYHAFKKSDNELSFWRRMDRFAIFVMIAGSYTPVCYVYLSGYWCWIMIAAQWALVGFGLCTQIFFPRSSRVLYAVIYLTMGWLIALPLNQVLAQTMPLQKQMLLLGGSAFTLGALMYATKLPRMRPGVFSAHELFHVMVLIGGTCHFVLIYDIMKYPA